MKQRIVQVILVIAVLGVAVVIARSMGGKRGGPKRQKPPESKQNVEVYTPEAFADRFSIKLLGKTMPAREVTLQAEVVGLATALHPQLVAGGIVKAGEVLLEMEKSEYQLAIGQAQAQVEQAKVRVQEEEGRRAVAEKEWALVGKGLQTSESGRALALREPQLKSARAALKAAQNGLARARLALKRTTIKAPMNAVILRESVEVGQRLGPGYGMLTIAGTDQWWVQVSVPQRLLKFIEGPDVTVTVHGRDGSAGLAARVLRRLPDLDPVGKMVRLIVAVDDPMRLAGDGPGIFLNDTVDLKFHCLAPGTSALPRRALRTGDRLWFADDKQTLQVRSADVYYKNESIVLVKGLDPKSLVVTSGLSLPTPGTALKWDTPRTLSADKAPVGVGTSTRNEAP